MQTHPDITACSNVRMGLHDRLEKATTAKNFFGLLGAKSLALGLQGVAGAAIVHGSACNDRQGSQPSGGVKLN